MKRKVFLFIVIAFIFIFFTVSCVENDEYMVSGDFIYEIVKAVNKNSDRCNNHESSNLDNSFVRIMGLSEIGKEKEIIIVPQFINGIEVKEFGKQFYTMEGCWESDNLRKVFITNLPNKLLDIFECPNLVSVIILTNEIPHENRIDPDVYISSYYHVEGDIWNHTIITEYREGAVGCYCANVSYYYNYNDAPNCGYYWLDNYNYGSLITYIPINPTREGYIFDGWYKEPECINIWNFDNDKLPNAIINNNNENAYQETKLYAKWIEEF